MECYFLFCLIFLLSSLSSRVVVLSQGVSCPQTQGMLRNVWRNFLLSQLQKEAFHWAASEQRPVILLNILQYTRQHPSPPPNKE